MKWGLEIREHHAFETHLNLMSDFTGSRERMSTTTSFGSHFDIVQRSFFKIEARTALITELKRRRANFLLGNENVFSYGK